MKILRALFMYRRMHRRISNQRQQLTRLQKSHNEWLSVAAKLAHMRREDYRKDCASIQWPQEREP